MDRGPGWLPTSHPSPDLIRPMTSCARIPGDADEAQRDRRGDRRLVRSENALDYGGINAATNTLFKVIKKAGLKFAICYEDQTIQHLIDSGNFTADQAIEHGQKVMTLPPDEPGSRPGLCERSTASRCC